MAIRNFLKLGIITLALLAGHASAWAQQPAQSAPVPASAAAPAVSQQELDKLLAPIALYPDALVAQILMGATYPLEIVQAARWSKANPKVTGKALEDAMQKQDWDPAVKALTAVPQVLGQMNDNLTWTQNLGDAFLADQAAVLKTVQSLRAKAQAAGNLKSTPEQTVKMQQEGGTTVIIIESPKPEVVYVPAYDPAVIYGTWPYPAPPYYVYPPAYPYGRGLAFATGVAVGAAVWGNTNWGGGEVNINKTSYNNFNKSNVQNNKFQHNSDHRKGVSYGNQAASQKYGRGGDTAGAQSRQESRGREQGGAGTQAADRGSASGGAGSGSRSPSAESRGGGGGGSGGGGGFSGASAGKSTQAASSRGSASRSASGGGRSGGGGGRR
jgi:uncharacterized membrane protein YgcG